MCFGELATFDSTSGGPIRNWVIAVLCSSGCKFHRISEFTSTHIVWFFFAPEDPFVYCCAWKMLENVRVLNLNTMATTNSTLAWALDVQKYSFVSLVKRSPVSNFMTRNLIEVWSLYRDSLTGTNISEFWPRDTRGSRRSATSPWKLKIRSEIDRPTAS